MKIPFLKPMLERKHYCGRCGKEMLPASDKHGYDVDTGQPKIHKFRACPTALAGVLRCPGMFDEDVWCSGY